MVGAFNPVEWGFGTPRCTQPGTEPRIGTYCIAGTGRRKPSPTLLCGRTRTRRTFGIHERWLPEARGSDQEEETVADIRDRMIRAAKLDAQLYEEVEADKGAMGQAMGVVILSAIAAGIGNVANGGLVGILVMTIGALVGWYIWAFLTYFIGTRFLAEAQTEADQGELLRTIGFSASPGIIRVLGLIPGIREIVFLVAGIWMLVAMVIAVRQALDYTSTWRAIVVCAIGWVIQAIILSIILAVVGTG